MRVTDSLGLIYEDCDFSLETMLGLSVIHCSVGRLVDRLHVALDSHERRLVDKDRREEISMEWQHCALVIDRLGNIMNI